jgi:hypothetical protein
LVIEELELTSNQSRDLCDQTRLWQLFDCEVMSTTGCVGETQRLSLAVHILGQDLEDT